MCFFFKKSDICCIIREIYLSLHRFGTQFLPKNILETLLSETGKLNKYHATRPLTTQWRAATRRRDPTSVGSEEVGRLQRMAMFQILFLGVFSRRHNEAPFFVPVCRGAGAGLLNQHQRGLEGRTRPETASDGGSKKRAAVTQNGKEAQDTKKKGRMVSMVSISVRKMNIAKSRNRGLLYI